jgi:hypothetical protein
MMMRMRAKLPIALWEKHHDPGAQKKPKNTFIIIIATQELAGCLP